jgi:type II secretory pathway pseudopilin PulG
MILKSNSRIRRFDNKGFTIVELLVASAVTMVIATIMIALMSNILSSWGRLSGTLTTGSQARLVLEVLAEDLQSAYYENDGNIWLAASILHDAGPGLGTVNNSGDWSTDQQNPQTQKPIQTDSRYLRLLPEYSGWPSVSGQPDAPFNATTMPWRYGAGGTWLRFITAGPDPSGEQLPRAVSYQIIRRPVTVAPDAEIRYMFYRSAVSAEETLQSGYHLGHDDPKLPPKFPLSRSEPYYDSETSPGHLFDPSAGDPTTITRPRREAVIANDVIDFGVRFYIRDQASGLLDLIFPYPGSSGPSAGPDRHYFAGQIIPGSPLEIIPMPDVADVFIRVLTPEGAKLIRNHEALPAGVNPPDEWWEIAEAHSQVFVRRVQLRPR